MFSVIPTVLLAGPLALLAALCPVAFAALAVSCRRWGVLLGVASVNSTLYLAFGWLRGHADGAWWGTAQALALTLASVAGLGAILALGRAWRGRRSGQPMAEPGRIALWTFGVAGVVGLAVVVYAAVDGALLRSPLRDALPVVAALGVGTLCLLVRASVKFVEAATLASLGAGYLIVGGIEHAPVAAEIVWTFEAVERGVILSSPLVEGERVYVSAAHGSPRGLFGAVHALERRTGKLVWTFDGGGKMKQALSSATLDAGRLYVGEGLHEDAECRLYCLDAQTGKERWSFVAKSHVESSPRVADGCVYFGAGDDGVYCLDAATGKLRWQFPGLHVDATPAIVGNRLYACSAYGGSEMSCLDSATGKPIWRTPSDVSVFGSPAVAGTEVYFGFGNGKLTRSVPPNAGGLICLDAATGARRWHYDAGDAVLGAAAISEELVFFGSRDHHAYALERRAGELHWKRDLGSPIVAAPLVVGDHVCVTTSAGRIAYLHAASGAIVWQFDLGKHSRMNPQLVSRPTLDAGSRLYLGAGLNYGISSAAVVYCLKVPKIAR